MAGYVDYKRVLDAILDQRDEIQELKVSNEQLVDDNKWLRDQMKFDEKECQYWFDSHKKEKRKHSLATKKINDLMEDLETAKNDSAEWEAKWAETQENLDDAYLTVGSQWRDIKQIYKMLLDVKNVIDVANVVTWIKDNYDVGTED